MFYSSSNHRQIIIKSFHAIVELSIVDAVHIQYTNMSVSATAGRRTIVHNNICGDDSIGAITTTTAGAKEKQKAYKI